MTEVVVPGGSVMVSPGKLSGEFYFLPEINLSGAVLPAIGQLPEEPWAL